MKIHNEFGQGSQAWMEYRAGRVTASEMDALITPLWKIRTGEGVQSYLARKLAEKWSGPLPAFGGGVQPFFAEQGQLLEQEIIPWYEYEFEERIQRVGFITNDSESCGCSPDGLLGEDGGIEIKAPAIQTHVRYLLDGELPSEYRAQVYCSLYVTGRKWWKFVSCRRGFPPLILTIERDEAVLSKIHEAVARFLVTFEEGWKRLVELNDGIAPKREPMVFAHEYRSEFPS